MLDPLKTQQTPPVLNEAVCFYTLKDLLVSNVMFLFLFFFLFLVFISEDFIDKGPQI